MDKQARLAKRETASFNPAASSHKEFSLQRRATNVSIKASHDQVYEVNSIEHFIHQPINCGFLFAFCESEFCSENIKFAMEIDRFRDYMAIDFEAWGPYRSWKEIDKEIGLSMRANQMFDVDKEFIIPLHTGTLINKDLWPSKKIDLVETENMLKDIWDTFLSDDAESQICMPSRVLSNTIARLKHLHLYGEEVFSEAMLDPIKTIRVDIQPRFLVSPLYKEMIRRLDEAENLPLAITLHESEPDHTIKNKYRTEQMKEEGFVFNKIEDWLEDRILYDTFLKYLDRKVCSENLRCVRFIDHFRSLMNSCALDASIYPQAYEMGWTIYKYFIAEDSSYEVSLSSRRRKEVCRELAKPNKNTFDKLEKSCMAVVKGYFLEFKTTKQFKDMAQTVLNYQEIRGPEETKAQHDGCFAFMHK